MNSSNRQQTVQDIVTQIGKNGNSVYVLFSGGKDSLAALSLVGAACKSLDKKVVAVHADTTVGIPDNLEYVIEACRLRWTPSLGQDKGYIKRGSRCPQGVCYPGIWC